MPLICSSDHLESSPTKQRNKRKSQEPKRLPSFEQTNDEQTSDGEDHAISPSPRLSSLSPGIIFNKKKGKVIDQAITQSSTFVATNSRFLSLSRDITKYII